MSDTKGVLEVGGLVAEALALEVVEDVGPKDESVKFVFDPGAVLRCGSGELFAQEKQGLARSMASGIMKVGRKVCARSVPHEPSVVRIERGVSRS